MESFLPRHFLPNLLAIDPEAGSAFVRELLEVYLQDAGRRIALIEAGLLVRDYPSIKAAAHALKGGSGSIGLERLSSLAYTLELGAKREDLPSLLAAYPRLKAEYRGTDTEIRTLLPSPALG